jgi:hypothetical protein
MQIQGHDALFRISETLIRLGTENDLVLAKQLFEFASVDLPPFTIERINHDLDNNYVIALHGPPTRQGHECRRLGHRTCPSASLGPRYIGPFEKGDPRRRKPGEGSAQGMA